MIPGPVFTTATIFGNLLGELPAAGVATLGIFLPAFFFVAVSWPLIPCLRRSAIAVSELDGVDVASLALMTVVPWHLGRAALADSLTVVLALATTVLQLRCKVNSAWLMVGGAGADGLRLWVFSDGRTGKEDQQSAVAESAKIANSTFLRTMEATKALVVSDSNALP